MKHVAGPDATRQEVKDRIREQLDNARGEDIEHVLSGVIDLAARLSLMVDVGKLNRGFVPGQKPLEWETGTLKDLVETRFANAVNLPLRVVRVKLDRLFTARNLERIVGLQVVWTDNISDHLRLMVDDTRVAIFHHVSFLEHHRTSSIFPPGFIDETLSTLVFEVRQSIM
jgi:hypothetical protein